MPVWHERTRESQAAGRVAVLGLIVEQHPERCRLFMQWQQLDFPIWVDPYNLLAVEAVPITLGIDERGIVRSLLRRPEELAAFLAADFSGREAAAAAPPGYGGEAWQRLAAAASDGDAAAVGRLIERLEPLVATGDADGRARFALGVAYRMRSESGTARPGDFAAAVAAWQGALDAHPNQYIWRRRIQQYGPRLEKPYPFYDWVSEAQDAVRARGETPVALRVTLTDSERAGKADFAAAAAAIDLEPDPAGRVALDDPPLIRAEAVAVPPVIAPGAATRVHLTFRTNREQGGHFNNEAEPLTAWVEPPAGWEVSQRRLTAPNATDRAVDEAPRRLELELRAPESAEAGTYRLTGYALYNCCTGPTGACLFRRNAFEAAVVVRTGE